MIPLYMSNDMQFNIGISFLITLISLALISPTIVFYWQTMKNKDYKTPLLIFGILLSLILIFYLCIDLIPRGKILYETLQVLEALISIVIIIVLGISTLLWPLVIIIYIIGASFLFWWGWRSIKNKKYKKVWQVLKDGKILIVKHLIMMVLFATVLLFYEYRPMKAKFTHITVGTNINNSSKFTETVLVKNVPKNTLKQSKIMIAYFEDKGISIDELSSMPDIKFYEMEFYRSTATTRKYHAKNNPRYRPNENRTYLGSLNTWQCRDDSTQWKIHISRNLGAIYEDGSPRSQYFRLYNDCDPYSFTNDENYELAAYYMELLEKRKNAVDITDAYISDNFNISDFEMILVEAGTFTMGCTPEQYEHCSDNESPAHRVTITNDFYIGKYPVTQRQWVSVMGSNPSYFSGDDLRPVENVRWSDVQIFITTLNRLSGKNFRLPTEAEWEYAARGGVKSMGYRYSGSNNIGDVAWYVVRDRYGGWNAGGNNDGTTHRVGGKKPNELGIHDMSGNVWEWVNDWYGDYPAEPQTDPIGPLSGRSRVLRGGPWNVTSGVSSRFSRRQGDRNHYQGFRLVLEP